MPLETMWPRIWISDVMSVTIGQFAPPKGARAPIILVQYGSILEVPIWNQAVVNLFKFILKLIWSPSGLAPLWSVQTHLVAADVKRLAKLRNDFICNEAAQWNSRKSCRALGNHHPIELEWSLNFQRFTYWAMLNTKRKIHNFLYGVAWGTIGRTETHQLQRHPNPFYQQEPFIKPTMLTSSSSLERLGRVALLSTT